MAVCRLNSSNNLMRKSLLKLKQQYDMIQKQNMGYAFVFFDKEDSLKQFKKFFKAYKKDKKNKHFVEHYMCANWKI